MNGQTLLRGNFGRKFKPTLISQMVGLLILAFSLVSVGSAQNQYDKGTPPQHATGVSPLGSYLSTELGNVNLTNGALNMQLPVTTVGGRGFSVPITLNYSSKLWSAELGSEANSDPPPATKPTVWAVYDDPNKLIDYYSDIAPGWTVGAVPTLRGRGSPTSTVKVNSTGCTNAVSIVTRLSLALPGGGEIEFRDDNKDGAPVNPSTGPGNCKQMDYQRGTRWHATDGSGAVFINDVPNGVATGNLNGWVITSDGTRYRFVNATSNGASTMYLKATGRATQIIDRHGNKIEISYPNSSTINYTDQLGRMTTIEYGATDPQNPGQTLTLLVTTPGYNGQPRYFKIKNGVMNQNYGAGVNPNLPVYNGDYDPMGYGYGCTNNCTRLFEFSHGSMKDRIDDDSVLTQIILPDNRTLNFKYNQFGEVNEIIMPTGGKVQYDYQYVNTLPSGNSYTWEVKAIPPGGGNVQDIDRAVITKRTFENGTNLESSTTYGYNRYPISGGTEQYTDVKSFDAGSVMMSNQQHFFLAGGRYFGLPNGGGTGYSIWTTGLERRTEVRDANDVVISASEKDWSQRTAVIWTGYTTEQIQNDNRVNETRAILDDGKTARTTMLYDSFNNPTQVSEYDFDNTLKRRTTTAYLTTNPVNSINYLSDTYRLLRLPTNQSVFDAANVKQAETIFEYDNYANDGNNAPLTSYASVTGFDAANYGVSRTARGNLTRGGSWENTNNSYLYAFSRFDLLGNVVSAKDAKGNISTISYTDDYGLGTNPGGGTVGANGATYAFPTLMTSPPPISGGTPHTARTQYDFASGLLTGFKDRNNVVSQTIYDDPFNRPTWTKAALGTPQEIHSKMYYAGATPVTYYGITLTKNDVLSVSDFQTANDAGIRSWTKTDGYGRTIEGWKYDTAGDVKTNTIYDAIGRTKQVSNPYRPSLSEPVYYTTSNYDFAGRVISVTTPDGAIVSTAYASNVVTITDQAGKQRRSISNGLGQLIRVDEPDDSGNLGTVASPTQATSYIYNTLNNLVQVNQGVQQRNFTYNSLSRLLTATNPESGTINYGYDASGNLTNKTDARSITTTYIYDNLNRVLTRSYSDGTPTVTYTYDNLTNAVGRLTQVTSAISTTNYTSFDSVGRVLSSQQLTDGQTYNFGYSYNLSGALVSETYPSGRVATNQFEIDGDLAQVNGSFQGNNKTYVGSFSYTSEGAVSAMQLGNGKWENTVFNSRLQPTQIGLGNSQTTQELWKVNYDYGTTDNNGNVKSQQITVPSQFTAIQNYSYDSLNRLKSATETISGSQTWKQTFLFDRYGNRKFDASQTTTLGNCPVAVCNPDISVNNNRVVGHSFDNSGNTTVDGEGKQFFYDAENKQKEVRNAQNQIIGQYLYDGDGKRVKKIAANDTTIFVYDAGGKLASEYLITASQSQAPQTSYLTNDTLGSPRVTTDSSGNVMSRRDFRPYGEEIYRPNQGTDKVRQKFTLYERDNETNLDYAKARMFGSGLGRFTSPDDFLNDTHVSDPQSWNLYVYVRNNPLRYVDPNGQIKKDENGNVIKDERIDKDSNTKTINGKTYYVFPGKIDGKTVVWEVKKVWIYGDNDKDNKNGIKAYETVGEMQILEKTKDEKGKTVESLMSVDKSKEIIDKAGNSTILPFSNKTNCHGTTFASGQVWIENDQVNKVMKYDGFRSLGSSETPQVGDVGVYGTDTYVNDHSVRVNLVNNGKVANVRSKGGIQRELVVPPGPGINTAWYDPDPTTKVQYFTQRPKAKN